ncbi:hypothetical protein E6O75_ATG06068 [Venturia nashicola]|uniref:Uncharacterized protein n=1 Tax=Venturia nashicola TaxID=86259 RepID=A0A4Z1NWE7_9PEZI|nr:hypothetical protein E6O75_ATG06068 [Venturia nashicola]
MGNQGERSRSNQLLIPWLAHYDMIFEATRTIVLTILALKDGGSSQLTGYVSQRLLQRLRRKLAWPLLDSSSLSASRVHMRLCGLYASQYSVPVESSSTTT